MMVLPKPVFFEWDRGNIEKNYLKHEVTWREAERVFINEPQFIFHDTNHSDQEPRYMIWGITNEGRKLSVFFTMRSGKIRVISARDMHKKERREYEKKAKADTKIQKRG